MSAGGCLFCSIATGETPADVVLEDHDFVGFLDHRPVFQGHVLLVPRQHVVTLPELPAALHVGWVSWQQRLATLQASTKPQPDQGSMTA